MKLTRKHLVIANSINVFTHWNYPRNEFVDDKCNTNSNAWNMKREIKKKKTKSGFIRNEDIDIYWHQQSYWMPTNRFQTIAKLVEKVMRIVEIYAHNIKYCGEKNTESKPTLHKASLQWWWFDSSQSSSYVDISKKIRCKWLCS